MTPSRPPLAALMARLGCRWSEFNRGGHVAALEPPDILTADVRDFFGSLH